jgi:hypothetical protein
MNKKTIYLSFYKMTTQGDNMELTITTTNLDKTQDVPKVSFDEASYESGINWCFFRIQQAGLVAVFRLHMEDAICWELFKAIDTPALHPTFKSGLGFTYGSRIRKDAISLGEKLSIEDAVPKDFNWLEQMLAEGRLPTERFTNSWCEYHGVNFFAAVKP